MQFDKLRLDAVWARNSPEELIIAASITAGVLLITWLVLVVLRRKLANAYKSATQVDDFVLDVAHRTKLLLLVLPAILLGTRVLHLPKGLALVIRDGASLSMIAQSVLWATGVVDFWLKRYRRTRMETDPAAVTTLNVFRIGAISILWTIALLLAIQTLGFNVTTLIAGLGIGGVAVALATQNMLGDLFASLSIVIDKPFVIGDFIIVGESMGTVEQVGLKTTRIRSLSGEQLILGNADLLQSRIRNYKRMTERRVLFRIGVLYQTTSEHLERIPLLIRAAIEKQKGIRFDRSHFVNFGDSSYDFETVYWVLSPDYTKFCDIHQAICFDLIRAFAAQGIELAYPTRTIFLEGGETHALPPAPAPLPSNATEG
jgi:small-conductance mechanosensitive channel